MRQAKRRKGRVITELFVLSIAIVLAMWMARIGLSAYYQRAYPVRYETLIDAACEEKGLDRALVYAVVRTESHFNPEAVSHVGARGLMQIMPDAFDWVRMRQGKTGEPEKGLFDPETNIDIGTEMLKMFLDEFDSVENVLCAYHAGRGSLMEWLKNEEYSPDGVSVSSIPFADTKAYVKKVTDTMEVYRKIYGM